MVGYWATAGAVSNSLNKVKHGSTTLFWAGNLHAFFFNPDVTDWWGGQTVGQREQRRPNEIHLQVRFV